MGAILGSWKEIASYLGKGVRTVQRWERMLALPVHRPEGATYGVVLAFPAELDIWAGRHRAAINPNGASRGLVEPGHTTQADGHLLQQAMRVQQLAQALTLRCQELALGNERRNAARRKMSAGRGQRDELLRKLKQNRDNGEALRLRAVSAAGVRRKSRH